MNWPARENWLDFYLSTIEPAKFKTKKIEFKVTSFSFICIISKSLKATRFVCLGQSVEIEIDNKVKRQNKTCNKTLILRAAVRLPVSKK